MVDAPPGTQPPRRFRPRLHWELALCALRGHELVGTDAAELSDADAIFAREDASGTRWYRCLRCDSWLALPAPAAPTRPAPPVRREIELPLRGKLLRDKVVLRLIAINRAFHFVVLGALGALVLVFAANRASPLKILAFVVNVVIVIYLLLAKRLFGLRGGTAAEAAEVKRDQGWEALERASPPLPPAPEAPPARA